MKCPNGVCLAAALLWLVVCSVALPAQTGATEGDTSPVQVVGELKPPPELETVSGVQGWLVNGEQITLEEVESEATRYYGRYVLQDLVAELLLQQEAERRGVSLTEEEVDEKVKQLREEFGLRTDDALDMFLRSQRRTLDWLRAKARQYALMEKVLSDQVYVSDSEIEQHYRQRQDLYRRNETVAFRTMAFASEDDANQALSQIRQGRNFREVAKETARSAVQREISGELQQYERGQHPGLPPELEAIIFSAPLNQVTGPIELEGTYHLIRVEKKTDPQQLTLDQVREVIRQQLRRQKLEQVVWPNWIRMQLANAQIEVIRAETAGEEPE